ncbi:MAG: DNA primase [Planctomycetota bacterium]
MPSGAFQDNSDRDKVREASDIVRIIGEQLSLKPKGREFIGLCPFHDDHTPSMCVIPHKQIFHCFSCGAGGDVFTFVQKYHGMSFPEAMKFLADRSGIELTPRHRTPDEIQRSQQSKDERERLRAAAAFAESFFRRILAHEQHGHTARALVERRGISDEMIERFRIGAAPDRWEGLLETAASKLGSPSPADFRLAGLAKDRQSGGGLYDAFRDRMIFPIHDEAGQAIAFGGRRMADGEGADEKGPKYLNSPETPLFDKSTTLFGLHQATRAIGRENRAIIVEGYIDVIACHQAGFENVVGTLGTAFTAGHARKLRQRCHEIVLLFDGDEAGLRAADRAFEVMFTERKDIRIATLDGIDGVKDPDDLFKLPDGRELFRERLDEAIPLVTFHFERFRRANEQAGSMALGQLVGAEVGRLVGLGLGSLDPASQNGVIRELSRATRLPEAAVRELVATAKSVSGSRRAEFVPTEQNAPAGADPEGDTIRRLGTGRLSRLETLLGCVLTAPELAAMVEAQGAAALKPEGYSSPVVQRVAQAVTDRLAGGDTPGLSGVLADLEDDQPAKSAAVALQRRTDQVCESKPDRVRQHAAETLRLLERERTLAETPASGDDISDKLARLRRAHADTAGSPRAAFPGRSRTPGGSGGPDSSTHGPGFGQGLGDEGPNDRR